MKVEYILGYYKNTYDGHSNPSVWYGKSYPYNATFEEKMELWKKDSTERNRVIEAKEHTVKDTDSKKVENSKRRKIANAKKNGRE
jgi:hypothetical protein